jgi:hypothetical protein
LLINLLSVYMILTWPSQHLSQGFLPRSQLGFLYGDFCITLFRTITFRL